MRILLDSNLPSAFAALLPGHRTDTSHARRWSDLDDGPLQDAAEHEDDAFITLDENLRFQQNLRGRRLRLLIVRALRNTLPILAPLAPDVLVALSEMGEGDRRVVGA